ncbi:MAG: hypothetical protein AAB491_00145 [Patescibacteria group bacterium]
MREINKKFLLTISTFIILNVILLSFWGYLYVKMKEKGDYIFNTKKEIVIIENNLNNIKLLEDFLGDITKEKEIIDAVFLESDRDEKIINFIQYLESLAEVANVSLELSGDVPKFDLKIKGELENIIKFTKFLDNMNYWISYDKANLQRIENGADVRVLWQADLNIVVKSYLSKNENN